MTEQSERLTEASKKALLAVERGEVRRIYDARGNRILGSDGVASTTLWKCERAGLIKDGPPSPGAITTRCPMILTDKGRAALKSSSGG